jgi:hypothetical protein
MRQLLPKRPMGTTIDFDFGCTSILPAETDSVLFVDSDAVLACPIATKSLETVTGRNGKVLQFRFTWSMDYQETM